MSSTMASSWVWLYGAKMSKANLSGANLTSANLFGANLTSASLTGTNWARDLVPHHPARTAPTALPTAEPASATSQNWYHPA
jgi:hypothetical protein